MFILPHNEISIYSFGWKKEAVLVVVVVEKLKPMAENIEHHSYSHKFRQLYMLCWGGVCMVHNFFTFTQTQVPPTGNC